MKLAIPLALLFPLFGLSQQKIENDTLYVGELKYYDGYQIKLGFGSNVATKDFNYIYTSPMSIAGIQYLGKSWQGHKMTVKNVKKYGTKKTGDKYYLILGGGNIVNYWCEIEAALSTGEVIDDRVIKKVDSKGSSISVADEIAKLKKLYDDGVLTKEEYEAQKKKLLDQK